MKIPIKVYLLFHAVFLFNQAHGQLWQQYNDSAVVFFNQNRLDKAIEYFSKTRKELMNGPVTHMYAVTCNNLADTYYALGQYQKAEPLYLESKQICEQVLGKDHPEYAASCNNLALFYSTIGQYQKAELVYLETKQIDEKLTGKRHLNYAISCNNLANLYTKMGEYQKAESLYFESKQIKEKLLRKEYPGNGVSWNDLFSSYAYSCNDLALLYSEMGQNEKAGPLYLEAKQIREKVLGKEDPLYTTSCINLAAFYGDIGQYQKAEPLYLEAKRLDEKLLGREHPDYATTCENLAYLYYKMGQYQKSEPLYLEAMQIKEKALGKEHPEYVRTCDKLAVLYHMTGRYEEARRSYSMAKESFEKVLGKAHPNYVYSCVNLAQLYWDQSRYEDAQTLFKEAFNLSLGNVKRLFEFTSEAEKYSSLVEADIYNQLYYSFAAFAPIDDRSELYNISLRYRNLVLSSLQQLRQLMTGTNAVTQTRYNEWMETRKQFSVLYTGSIAKDSEQLKSLAEKANNLEKELTLLSAPFRQQQAQTEITWRTIQQSLGQNEAAIEFVEFQYYKPKRWTDSTFYIALLLRKDKPEPQLIHLFEKKQLDSLFRNAGENGNRFIASLYVEEVGANTPATRSLYSLVWQPLEKYLEGITRVYFAPSGLLHRISFAALSVNGEQKLSDKYQLVQLSTTASVVGLSSGSLAANDKIQLYGGIQYDADSSSLKKAAYAYHGAAPDPPSLSKELIRGGSGFKYLPGTETEISTIEKLGEKKHYTVVALNSAAASEESVKALNGKSSPAILHIATHGFFFSDPKQNKEDIFQLRFGGGKAFKQSDNPLFRSGLIMAGANYAWKGKPIEGIEDGILTAYEVSNLYLPNAKLVVLSACETGLGDIQGSEGVYGLQRAFKIAGVQNLVMSLWKVPDAETAEFMQEFYKHLFNKIPISDAFYKAQTTMKNKYRSELYKWAAWVLVR